VEFVLFKFKNQIYKKKIYIFFLICGKTILLAARRQSVKNKACGNIEKIMDNVSHLIFEADLKKVS